ncbi:hypothetical protein [Prevotella falsenii]
MEQKTIQPENKNKVTNGAELSSNGESCCCAQSHRNGMVNSTD